MPRRNEFQDGDAGRWTCTVTTDHPRGRVQWATCESHLDEAAGDGPALTPAVCTLSLDETSSACYNIQGGRALPALPCKQCRGDGYTSTDTCHREGSPVSAPPDTLASGEDTSPTLLLCLKTALLSALAENSPWMLQTHLARKKTEITPRSPKSGG